MNYWPYEDGGLYYWTKSGVHRFFGWTSYDAVNKTEFSTLFGDSDIEYPGTVSENLEMTSHKLTLPEVTLTTDSPQFDMMYSDVESRSMNDKGNGVNKDKVDLTLYHLFTAVSMSLQNSMEDGKVTVNSISIPNLPNTGSATLTFSNSTIPKYDTVIVGKNPFMAERADIVLEAKGDGNDTKCYDLFAEKKYDSYSVGQFEPRFNWPLKKEYVSPSNLIDEKNRIYESSDSLITINYTVEVDGNSYTYENRHVKFPAKNWEAGTHYHFNLKFIDKQMYLETIVLPWTYGDYTLSYSEWAISVVNKLSFKAPYDKPSETTDEEGNTYKYITIEDGKPATGTFRITSPLNGTYRIVMDGDTEFFTITGDQGTIDPTKNEGDVTFTITPNLSLSRDSDKTITLSFYVEMNGKTVSADSEINRDNYRIILKK